MRATHQFAVRHSHGLFHCVDTGIHETCIARHKMQRNGAAWSAAGVGVRAVPNAQRLCLLFSSLNLIFLLKFVCDLNVLCGYDRYR